ncbi:hypothetical protein [Desulfofundulus thermosubterraneus]|uniref:hypothetical protein n=1 Tax=Desulfofundulus thermosubterraneus TaxID=348840 RepID=UPI000933E282|nr:hypothetical protein [Desulfofundulus thermosubterraneus]
MNSARGFPVKAAMVAMDVGTYTSAGRVSPFSGLSKLYKGLYGLSAGRPFWAIFQTTIQRAVFGDGGRVEGWSNLIETLPDLM